MTNLTDELPQLIISALFIILIGVLLVTRVITTSDPIFINGSGSILLLIAAYWLGNGLVRLSHSQTMKAVVHAQGIPTPVQPPESVTDHATQPMPVATPDETTQPHVI